MELKPIKTKAEYKAALSEVEALFDVPDKTPEADRLEVLVMLVEKYEAQHYPIAASDPIDFLHYAMETRGLTRKDLEAYIGSRGRVAEVLNRARPLTLAMIRRLSDGLKLPADVLIADYDLRRAA
ncbi:MAG: transcriptional regulator [Gallionellaceae bacterium]|nr:transcriptional regulator [Gallionellaceae bacterium]